MTLYGGGLPGPATLHCDSNGYSHILDNILHVNITF